MNKQKATNYKKVVVVGTVILFALVALAIIVPSPTVKAILLIAAPILLVAMALGVLFAEDDSEKTYEDGWYDKK